MTYRGADAANLRGRHRRAHARPTHEDAALRVSPEDGLADLPRLVGIVDAGRRGVGAEIQRVVTERGQLGEQPLTELHAPVVERDGDLHGAKVTPPRSH